MSPFSLGDREDGDHFQTLEMNFSAGDKNAFQKESNKKGNRSEELTESFL